MWFNKRRYVLVNLDTKEDVYESKEMLLKEVVLEDIESENLEDALYRAEERVNGRKVRNTWVMRKARKPKSPEELAAKSREDAEEFIAKDAQDIKDRVDAHKAFAAKVKETYGIENTGGVDNINIPTSADGKVSIIGLANQAIAESTYLGIRETRPEEVSNAFKSIMNSGTTILAGIAQMLTAKITESRNKPENKDTTDVKKEKEVEKKQDEVKKEKPKEVETHKEVVSEGVTKTTFGTGIDTDSSEPENTTSSLYDDYEQYKKDQLGGGEEDSEEGNEKKEEHEK